MTKRKDEGERVEEERRVGVRERGFERGAWVGERREGGGGGEGRVGGWNKTEVTERKGEGGRVEEERRVGGRKTVVDIAHLVTSTASPMYQVAGKRQVRKVA